MDYIINTPCGKIQGTKGNVEGINGGEVKLVLVYNKITGNRVDVYKLNIAFGALTDDVDMCVLDIYINVAEIKLGKRINGYFVTLCIYTVTEKMIVITCHACAYKTYDNAGYNKDGGKYHKDY